MELHLTLVAVSTEAPFTSDKAQDELLNNSELPESIRILDGLTDKERLSKRKLDQRGNVKHFHIYGQNAGETVEVWEAEVNKDPQHLPRYFSLRYLLEVAYAQRILSKRTRTSQMS